MKFRFIIYSTLFLLFGVTTCIETDETPTIPEITYLSHTSAYCEDEIGNLNKCIDLTFNLKDGNGDIGLSETDTLPPYTGIFKHNFYYNLLVMENGIMTPYNEIIANYFDIPYIQPQGQNKLLIADITIQFRFYVQNFEYDTLMIEFFIYDRALNQSNTEISDTIIFEQLPL